MPYQVCEKCGRIYKIEEGDSPDTAKKCECGASLNYVQNFDMHVMDDFDPFDEFITCPNCGKKNTKVSEQCESCGNPLNDTKVTEKSKLQQERKINLQLIIVCIIIFLIVIIIGIILRANPIYK